MKYPKYLKSIPGGYDPIATKEDCYFDNTAAEHIIKFFATQLVLAEGVPGCPNFILEEWQKAIVGNLFGWKRPDGTRRYRRGFFMIPKKNGKSPLMAGVINYVAFNEDEPGGQIYSTAGDMEQAAIIHRHASKQIQHNEEMTDNSRIYKTYHSIEFWGGDVIYKALSAEDGTKHGINAHLIIHDEVHVHKKRDLIECVDPSTASRRQPLILDITTAGFDKETICGERYEYACDVRDGVIDDKALLPIIYEIKKEDFKRWDDPIVWAYCNPNLGVSVNLDFIETACKMAKKIPAKENSFRRLHLNQWTQQQTRWLSVDTWKDCQYELISSKSIIWVAGLDLSTSIDLTCLTMLGIDSDGVLHWHCWPFMPKETAHLRELQDGVPYLTWAKQGYIELTEGNAIDFNFIEKRAKEECDRFGAVELAFDRMNATQIIQNLDAHGIEVTAYGQGFLSMNAPCKYLETQLLAGKIAHGNHPVLTWSISNVEVKQDDHDNIKPIKPKNTKRIDPVVSGLMALGRLISENRVKKKSVYETRGALIMGGK